MSKSFTPSSSASQLSPEQQAEAQQIYEELRAKSDRTLWQMAQLLASKENHQLLGLTEFEIRDLCHQVGAQALETAAEQRSQKRGL